MKLKYRDVERVGLTLLEAELLTLTLLNDNFVKYACLLLLSFSLFRSLNMDKLLFMNFHPVFSYFAVSYIQMPLEEISFV